MWHRDIALVEDRIGRLNSEAREAELRALARAHRPVRPHRVRALAAAAVRGLGHAALAAATRLDRPPADREPASLKNIVWHHS